MWAGHGHQASQRVLGASSEHNTAPFNILPTSTEKCHVFISKVEKQCYYQLPCGVQVPACANEVTSQPPNRPAEEVKIFTLPSELALGIYKVIIFLGQQIVNHRKTPTA